MNLITAVDKGFGIGCDGELLFSVPEDMQHFKRLTENKIVIMGNCTLKSLPKSQPLKKRTNIVLSRGETKIEGAVICNSIEQLFNQIKKYNPDDIFVIGGQFVYEQLIDYCTRAYITRIDSNLKADRFFPNIDDMAHWKLQSESPIKTHDGLSYVFTEYINTRPYSVAGISTE